ncbi:MAG: zinc-ribbon domain-containing protein [Desulfohalobiaceae bacterium]|nr:zinc-ribbon domain-containing protein [Desulfohalobiaceae bacterium]
MIVTCQHCGKKLKVDLSVVQGDQAKVRCKHCRQLFTVKKPPEEQEEAEGPAAGAGGAGQGPAAPAEGEELRTEGWSLKSKLTVIIVLIMFVSLSITGLIVGYYSRTTLASQAETHLMRIAQEKSQQYTGIFNRISDEVRGVAGYVSHLYQRGDFQSDIGFSVLMPWDGDSYGNEELNERYAQERLLMQRAGITLRSIVSENPFLSLGYYGSANDLLVLHSKKVHETIKELEGFTPTERPWYTKAAEQGEVIWTDPYVDANSKNLVVTCAAPVKGPDGAFLGAVGFDVLLETIQKDILEMDIGYSSYAFLVNQEGKVLVQPGMVAEGQSWDERYATDNLRETENEEFNSIVTDMVRGGTGFDSFTREGEEQFVAYTFLPSIKAGMAIVSPKKSVMEPAAQMQKIVLAVWGLMILITIWICLYVGRWITRPINNLTRMANLISQGKTDLEELPEDRKDELGLLTRSFNRLVASLRVVLSRRR